MIKNYFWTLFPLLLYNYIPITSTATLKNTKIEHMSTIVVINGAAIIAGSSFSFLAAIGNIPPTSLEITAVAIMVAPTTIESWPTCPA